MLGALDTIVTSDAFEENAFASVVSIRESRGEIIVELRVDEGDGPPTDANWRVLCGQRWRYWIDEDARGIVGYESDNPAVREFTDLQRTLFFGAAPVHADAVVGQLHAAHAAACAGWIPFDRFFNRQLSLQKLVEGGFGLLASGPEFLIQVYSNVLHDNGMNESSISGGPLRRWDGTRFHDAPSDLRPVQLGELFMVARVFRSERIG